MVLVMLMSGCRPGPVDPFAAAPPAGHDYDDALDDWTRHEKLYEGFEGRLFLHATFLSRPFRQAQRAHRAETERLTPDVLAELEQEDADALEAGHTFFVAAHTIEWEWNHLEGGTGAPLWRLRLINGRGDVVAPSEVRRVGEENARFMPLYPYYRDYYIGYIVRFPRRTAAGEEVVRPGVQDVVLRVSGPLGALDMRWEVDR